MPALAKIIRLPGFIIEVWRSNNLATALNGVREILLQQGFGALWRRLRELLGEREHYFFPDYGRWIDAVERQLPSCPTQTSETPHLISVLLPVYNPRPEYLRDAIESVRRQLYPHWELCIADDASSDSEVVELLRKYAASDPRIRLTLRKRNGHISAASNTALAMASGSYVALLDHDDTLPSDALSWVAHEIETQHDAVIIYSDEDRITAAGQRFGPIFKPAWDPDLMLQRNFVSHLGVYLTKAVRSVGGFRPGYEGSQDWDLALRVSEQCNPSQIRHIPRVLYHWRAIPGSTALHLREKSYAVEAGRLAVQDHIERTQSPVRCAPASSSPFWRLTVAAETATKITLFVGPFATAHESDSSIEALSQHISDEHCNIVPVILPKNKMESDLLTDLANSCHSDVFVFLRPQRVPNERNWLAELAGNSLRKGIGTVSPSLVGPTGTLSATGFQVDAKGILRSPYLGASKHHRGYLDMAILQQTVAAQSSGCLAVSRTAYRMAGGFAPSTYGGAMDLSLCLRLRRLGYRNLWLPQLQILAQTDIAASVATDFLLCANATNDRIDIGINPHLTLSSGFPALSYVDDANSESTVPTPLREQ